MPERCAPPRIRKGAVGDRPPDAARHPRARQGRPRRPRLGWPDRGFDLSSDTGALPGLRVGHRPPGPASDVGHGGAIVAWRLSARSERTSGVKRRRCERRHGDTGRHKPPTPSPTPTCGCMDPSCSSPTGPAPASRCTAPSCFGKSETRPLPTAASARAHPSPRRSRRSHRQSALLQGWEDNADTMTVERLNVSDTSFRRKHRTRS